MRLLSRFKKGNDEGSEDGADASLADVSEDEGLLMPTGAAAEPGTASAKPDLRTQQSALPRAIDAESASSEVEPSLAPEADALDAELADEAAEPESPLAEADELANEPPVEEAADDDPLSAFEVGVVSTELTSLTEGIEDVPINELAEQLREIRAMLPATSAEDEDVAA